MNNAGSLLLLLLGSIAVILLCVDIPFIMFYLGLGCLLTALNLAIFTVCKIRRHSQLKEFFRNEMSNADKEFINYIFTRKTLDKPGRLDKIFGITQERDFQQKRNEKLLQYHPKKAMELIKLEREINTMVPIFMIALQIGVFYIVKSRQ